MKGARKKNSAQRTSFTISGYILLFVAVAAVATVAILSYNLIYGASGDTLVSALSTAAILTALTFALCLAGIICRKAVTEKPVKTILAATEEMARGNFDIHLRPRHIWGRYDEYDVIMDNINKMAAELSKNEVLRNDFLANVSHEIKTPLSVIQNYAQALRGTALSAKERGEYADLLCAASRRLAGLISNILKLNKLENQKIFPEKRPVQAGELLRECVLSFEDAFESKGIELDCDIVDVGMVSDKGFLEIIFNNLVSNAVKFTERGGSVTVTLRDEGANICVCVRDTGCGMSAETGARIFDKFYQGDTSHSQEGNGLGLALVKRVIDILGGEISVDSRLGKGSAFTVKLRKE